MFIGKVWPGFTAFTDFMNFDTHQYWQNQVSKNDSNQDTLGAEERVLISEVS